jgi:mono/diheme cytochrome c family protein
MPLWIKEPTMKLGLASLATLLLITGFAWSDPVAHWDFGPEETSPLVAHGGVHRDVPGPRPPEFPDFEPNNTAVRFDGSGAHYSFAGTGKDSPLNFDNGDAITIEAWVDMDDVKGGENFYIVGKGRTGDPEFAKDNQNWALRVREQKGKAHASFLFATLRGKEAGLAKDAHWHRWTAGDGFLPGSGWHHLAVSYRFGDPLSIRSWLDGHPSDGAWDMGGPTRQAPVVDDDAVWIGSSNGGAPTNSFRGVLDAIAIHREQLSDEVMHSRFHRETSTAPAKPVVEAAPVLSNIPPGKVLVTFHEGLPAQNKWPSADQAIPPDTMRWLADSFVIPRLPMRYDDWGIRQAWKGPVLVRAAADVILPPGKNRFLVRARLLSRLWVDGHLVARTTLHSSNGDGYQPILPVPTPPLPGLRPVGYGDQEVFGDATVGTDGHCRVVLEAIVGGKKLRPEPGEMCVAVETADGKSFVLLAPHSDKVLPLTDQAWDHATAEIEAELTQLDDANRRTAAATQDAFWQQRHAQGRKWVAEHPAAAVPSAKQDRGNPIDAFLTARVDQAVAAASGPKTPAGMAFHEKVLPVLSDQCFRCHGEREKGGLKLNSREAILQAGDSGNAAVLPGNPAHSQILARLRATDPEERMPPKGDGLRPEQIAAIEAWINAGAPWPATPVLPQEVAVPPIINDSAFLRRAYLDCVGVPPTESEARAFLADASPEKRSQLVDRLLADPRFADHWVSYWQDVLAENPNILKPSLNNSGPFRWFLFEALRDGKPLDRMVTELVMLRGGTFVGGSAGFGMAADNDAPLAAKGQVIGGAFLGIELQCARCHDAPFHSSKQRDLYAISAMLSRKAVTVPKTSRVPLAFFEKTKARQSLIKVSLKPDEAIPPAWPFGKVCGVSDGSALDALLHDPKDTRERLAALITAPQNQRFAQVIVNRIWKRLIGAGFVEPAHDWEGHAASDPQLLDWLARELVAHDYDLKYIVRLIMTSQMYQRQPTGQNLKAQPEHRFFVAPDRRRLTAEQVVDSLFWASGKAMQVEELTFDPDDRHSAETMISLGKPCRSWMFASLSNERDRPSLSLPRARAVADVLEAFGWTGARQSPRTDRESDPNVLQPGVMENSIMCSWITRASLNSGLAQLAVDAKSPEDLVDAVFVRFLSRLPDDAERSRFAQALSSGFFERLVSPGAMAPIPPRKRLPRVSWSNHLMADATVIKEEMERNARAGDPPDPRLAPQWREQFEDFVWAVINSPEFVWVP